MYLTLENINQNGAIKACTNITSILKKQTIIDLLTT